MGNEDLIDWVKDILNVPSNSFGGLPACPYAMQAIKNNSVEILQPPLDMITVSNLLNNGKEVVIYWYDSDKISPTDLELECNKINDCYPELVALEDHPEVIEKVKDIKLNQGRWALILIQNREKLRKAREQLSQTEYYKNWSSEYLAEVLSV